MKRDKKTPTNDKANNKDITEKEVPEKPKCGLIMPISAIDGLPAAHWEDVKSILSEAIDGAGFTAELVSDTQESTIIHRTIVHNLYNNPIVVCDVSGKNPNVMFELGIRLTFDRPTVVVKDDKTDYSFDSSPIVHVIYPRDLRFQQIVKFKENLTARVRATYEKGTDPNYSTFLKHFGEFKVPQLEQKEVTPDQFIIERLEELSNSISRLEHQSYRTAGGPRRLMQFSTERLAREDVKYLIAYVNHRFENIEARVGPTDKLEVIIPGYEYTARERNEIFHHINQMIENFTEDNEPVSSAEMDARSGEQEVELPE